MNDDVGVLALWNDCAPAGEADYERWYMAQHLPERVETPGFRFGRRFEAVDAERRYFTFYEVDTPAVLVSDAYLARLNNPTDWTRQVMPSFKNTIRTVCHQPSTFGMIMGGHALTLRYGGTPGFLADAEAKFVEQLIPGLFDELGVCMARIWIRDDSQTPDDTAEVGIRGPDELIAGALVLEVRDAEVAVAMRDHVAVAPWLEADPVVGIYRFIGGLSAESVIGQAGSV